MQAHLSASARRIPVIVAVCVCALGARTARAQGDPFLQQRDAEAARNRSTGFSVSFADDRRTFHPGEAIKLTLAFRGHAISPFNWEHCHGLGIADIVLDHADGTADPQADLWNNGIIVGECGVLSGITGGIERRGNDLVEERTTHVPVYVNQAIRFDRPGTYRFYVRSRHESTVARNRERLLPLISNVLDLQIVASDEAWESNALQQLVRTLDSGAEDEATQDAARAVSYLGTSAAIDEIVRRCARDACGEHWIRGLYGAPRRADVVARFERELDRSDVFLSSQFVSHLAVLKATAEDVLRPIPRASYDAHLRAYSTRHLAALERAGRLPAYVRDVFVKAAEYSNLSAGVTAYLQRVGLTAGFSDFPDDVELAFASLPPADQRMILMDGRNWIVLHDPAFIPMLRRLASGTDKRGPQDIALRLLWDLAPEDARTISLRELANRDSIVGILGLSPLRDAELPQLDTLFVESLEQARVPEEVARAMDRIERFATGRIAVRVRRAYEKLARPISCKVAAPAFAYFFRVDPRYARREISSAATNVNDDEDCDDPRLLIATQRRTTAALETAAIRLATRGARDPIITAQPSRLPASEASFRDDRGSYFRSPEALQRWLSLHPRGTTFAWRENAEFNPDAWMPGESEALFGEIRAFVEARGMHLVRDYPTGVPEVPPAVAEALAHASDDKADRRAVLHAAIDAGTSAVPYLRQVLETGTEPERRLGRLALAYIRGEMAERAAFGEFLSRPSVEAKTAMHASGWNWYLIRELDPETPREGWTAAVNAALALGVGRETDARPALGRAIEDAPGTPLAAAATAALSWIGPRAPVKVLNAPAPHATIVSAVLAHGIPRSNEARRFVDRDRKGTWVRSAGTWAFRPGVSPTGADRAIAMDVHVSPDSMRALVSIALTFGPADRADYDYVLRRIGGRWIVQGVIAPWIP